ncbi:disintegrin and metalloproteinase domain-containing protein 23-like isoform X4 [Scleropages formosus]|uniref:disintegrin and metalloproteinase domain-containing protein 23-like isoform X4 n=1 Tax=Scleropages formosus TaxID=113540 RepID=UPI0010FA99A2|nr:disintegrin and metalloproteinase domain-containing protein 23-like isoform X4 [Scleropages formosus]
MYLIFLPNLLASILASWLSPVGLTSTVPTAAGNESASDAVTAAASGGDSAPPPPPPPQHEITYPSRLIYYLNEDSESTYHDLDTRTRSQGADSQVIHLAQASFQLEAFGSRFILDLTLNNDLLSSDYVEIHYEEGKPVLSKGGEHCYYHGQLRGIQNSRAALSTCNGLHGMFDDGQYVYLIEPLQQTHSIDSAARPHSLRRSHTLQWAEDPDTLTEEEMLLSELSEISWLKRRKKRAMPRNVFEEMKYLEIMIVSDHNLYKRHKSKQHTKNFAKSVVNFVDAVYKEHLHTRVVLVAVEIWTDQDHIPISVKPLEMLRDFSKYRQHSIKQHADAVHLFSNVTFHYRRSSAAYFAGVCSMTRGVGVNEYGTTWTMAAALLQSLAQNLGIQWDPAAKRKECGCVESWVGCIMEDTGVQHPRKFSKCSISDYKEFLLKGGGSCLFNRPTKLFEATECGNGYVEVGEECDCGGRAVSPFIGSLISVILLHYFRKHMCVHVCSGMPLWFVCMCVLLCVSLFQECYKECCKKCSLSNGAHCSDGPCCNTTCLFYPRGYGCRYAVNDCDISETCTGDSGQCPPNLHKQDGYSCHLNQGRCYSGECKTRDSQCRYIWGPKASASEKFCYEKLNTEGTEKGNCGKDGEKWIQCSKHDVFCGYLLCANIGRDPRIGMMKGDITPTSFNHQGRLVDCSGGHVLLDDETDLGYIEDGTPCGPSMMCLDRKCLPIQSFNMSACPSGSHGQVCSAHGVCNNEATCTCDATWAGTDCSMPDPPKEPPPSEDEGPKGPSATNLIIGSIAGAILVAAIVLGGTGWGFKNVKKRRYDPNASAI